MDRTISRKLKSVKIWQATDGTRFENHDQASEHQAKLELVTALLDIAATEDWTDSQIERLERLLEERMSDLSAHFRAYNKAINE